MYFICLCINIWVYIICYVKEHISSCLKSLMFFKFEIYQFSVFINFPVKESESALIPFIPFSSWLRQLRVWKLMPKGSKRKRTTQWADFLLCLFLGVTLAGTIFSHPLHNYGPFTTKQNKKFFFKKSSLGRGDGHMKHPYLLVNDLWIWALWAQV